MVKATVQRPCNEARLMLVFRCGVLEKALQRGR